MEAKHGCDQAPPVSRLRIFFHVSQSRLKENNNHAGKSAYKCGDKNDQSPF
jgi:hypothetical protein